MQSRQELLGVLVFVLGLVTSGVSASGQGPEPGPPWPHTVTVNGASVVVYQPQAIEWPNHETLTTREAVAITLPGGEDSGAWHDRDLVFDPDRCRDGDVILSNPQLLASHFPALDTEQASRIEQQIKTALPDIHARPVALQSVLLSLKQRARAGRCRPEQ